MISSKMIGTTKARQGRDTGACGTLVPYRRANNGRCKEKKSSSTGSSTQKKPPKREYHTTKSNAQAHHHCYGRQITDERETIKGYRGETVQPWIVGGGTGKKTL